jgi:hypothetical protein
MALVLAPTRAAVLEAVHNGIRADARDNVAIVVLDVVVVIGGRIRRRVERIVREKDLG